MTADRTNDTSPSSANPQDALQGYFDDLLGGVFDEPAAVSDSQVSPEPPKLPEPQPQRLAASAEARLVLDDEEDDDTASAAVSAHRARLEKLLRSARAQLVAEAEAPAPEILTPEIAAPEVAAVETLASSAVIVPVQADIVEPVTETIIPQPEVDLQPVPAAPEIEEPELDEVELPQAELDEPVIVEEELTTELENSSLSWCDNGRPQWAQERFDVLLFEVGGLTLAVPLIALGHIQPLTDELTPLFGQADWFMGLQPTPVGKIRTVNTAKFVMPERYDESFLASTRYVISIDGLSWGLAVDKVNQPITLNPADVKWRTERSKRPWLAGTVKEHMCALIDIPMMGQMLQDADRNTRRAVRRGA